jgi:hypothetical protein
MLADGDEEGGATMVLSVGLGKQEGRDLENLAMEQEWRL